MMDQAGVAAAVDALRVSYEHNAEEMRQLSGVMDHRFGRQRLWMAVLGAVVVLAVLMALGFRDADQDRRRAERQEAERRALVQRQSDLAGCRRANDLRLTLSRVIEEAYQPVPPSPSLSEELAELVRQSQVRAAERRESLLALPGIQPVDCELAYPDTSP